MKFSTNKKEKVIAQKAKVVYNYYQVIPQEVYDEHSPYGGKIRTGDEGAIVAPRRCEKAFTTLDYERST